MKVSEALLDERINNNTMVIIKDMDGLTAVCGRWYQDKILVWGRHDVSFNFDAERNIAVLQLVV